MAEQIMATYENFNTVLVTGASGYLGSAYVSSICKENQCILVDKDREALFELKSSLPISSDFEHFVLQCDLSNESARRAVIDRVSNDFSHLDVLVNCAAFTGDSELSGWITSFEEQSLSAWQSAFDVNLTAVFEISQGLAPMLRKSANGNILNVGSIYGTLGPDMRLYEGTNMGNPAAYAASKGGLVQLTKWLASVLAPKIRVNCVSPGGIFRKQPERFVKSYSKKTPLGRMATEDDIIGAMVFLTLGRSQYITGQNLLVDGGFSIW